VRWPLLFFTGDRPICEINLRGQGHS
jgi:hypothetical protein